MRRALLEVQDATVSVDETVLLPPTSLSVGRGTICAITGPNGSGKTTLLRVVMGRQALTGGHCALDGETPDLRRGDHRRLVASQVEPIPLDRDLTVREHVAVVAASWFGNDDGARDRAEGMLQRLGIAHLGERFPHQLSAGQLQLAVLALVLVRPATLLLLDEPERHLDADRVGLVARTLREVAASGTAVVLATHEPALVSAADRVTACG